MNNAVKIFGFTVLVLAFYAYVGQMVPQERDDPPETTELSADMSTEEMVEVGQEIFEDKGTCQTCHAVEEGEGTGRFPNLHDVGATAADRRENFDDVEYLAESLYEPSAYVVEGYNPAMPQVNQPPIDLSDREIKAIIAYLQSLGGTPTISMETTLGYESGDGASTEPASSGAEQPAASETETTAASASPATAEELFTEYMCNTCHLLDDPADKVGPSLHNVGTRMSRAEIYEEIMNPNARVREGYPEGTMKTTLEQAGFYEEVTAQELQRLVDLLAAQTGD